MPSGAGGPGRSFSTALEEPTDDRDSINVNPGSPPSPLPPLTQEQKEADRGQIKPKEPDNPLVIEETESSIDLKPPEVLEQPFRPEDSRFTVDPDGELTHDETTVDIVTVPCPGGDPLRTWNRDGLMSRYFGAPSMRDAEAADPDRPGPSWVRQGIRREANRARTLLYEHPELKEGTTLSILADALLTELHALQRREGQTRPLIFVGHSVGGIVVKMMLIKAGRNKRFDGILRQCYGVAFFGKKPVAVLWDLI